MYQVFGFVHLMHQVVPKWSICLYQKVRIQVSGQHLRVTGPSEWLSRQKGTSTQKWPCTYLFLSLMYLSSYQTGSGPPTTPTPTPTPTAVASGSSPPLLPLGLLSHSDSNCGSSCFDFALQVNCNLFRRFHHLPRRNLGAALKRLLEGLACFLSLSQLLLLILLSM